MTKETKKAEDRITKAGAVELDESALDDVSGGEIVNESISLNFSKIRHDSAVQDSSLSGYKITDGTSNTTLKR